MASHIHTYIWPGDTYFGFGAAELVGREAAARQMGHVLILTDAGVVAAGLLETITASLDEARLAYEVYDAIPGNPDIASVDAAADVFLQIGAEGILAVGGGSVLDAAKGVRLVAGGTREGAPEGARGSDGPGRPRIAEYALPLGDAVRPAPSSTLLPPMLAVPTTAGTGAEVTPWGVITDPDAGRKFGGRKFGIGGPYLVPDAAFVDPVLTLTLPPGLTAATGMDALSHLVEAYVSTNRNPILDPMILYGVRLIGRSLRAAVAQPGDRRAREEMMMGSLMGGIAISSNWLGACHSLAHPLSALAGLHHGVAIALMLPYQMAFSLHGAPERYAEVGAALGQEPAPDEPVHRRAERAVEAVRALVAEVGLPTRLREVGVDETLIPPLSAAAYRDTNWSCNPCPITAEDLEQIYRQACGPE
jgi:4-hydroxybutyrate dehydrogenase